MRTINVNDLDSINYYQVPKWLMDLFLQGKISAGGFKTYVLMYDRLRLSSKNKWIDEEGTVYIKYSYDEMQEDLNCSRQAISNNLKDLLALDLIVKVKNFNSSSKFYLKIYDSSQENFTSKEKLTNSSQEKLTNDSQEKLTNSSQVLLDANKNNYNKNNINNKIDDNNIYTIPEKNLPDEELDVSSIEFKNNFLEYKELVSKSTGMGMNIVDNLMANIIHTLKSQYDIKFLIQKIKESDFLMGKLETKPSTANFSKKVMLDRIMADEYKNKNNSKTLEIKSPAWRIIGDINPWEVED